MKKYRIWLWMIFSICSLGFVSSVFATEKENFEVTVQQAHIDGDICDVIYEGPLAITIHTMDKQTLASLVIEVKQNGVLKDIPILLDEENLMAKIHIDEGMNYDISIQAHEKKMHLLNISVYEKIPILVNGLPLMDDFSSDEDITLHVDNNTFWNFDASYLLINNERVSWISGENGYDMQLIKEGNYTIEFHFIDFEQHEVIFNTTIVKEVKDKNIGVNFIRPFNEYETNLYFLDTIEMVMKTNIIDIKELQIYVNEQPYDVEWNIQESGYEAYLNIIEEGSYQLHFYYEGKSIETMYDDKNLILDKTVPEVEFSPISNTNTNQDAELYFKAYDEHTLIYEINILKNGIPMQLDAGQGNIEKSYILHDEVGTNMYEIQAVVKDYAGNEKAIEPLMVTIDKEPPQIHPYIQGNVYEHPLLTNKNVHLRFECSDEFISKRILMIYKNEQLIEERMLEDNEFEKTVTSLQMRRDTYNYVLQVEDIAGNMSEEKINFTIDQDLPDLQIKNDIFHGNAKNVSWIPELVPLDKQIEIIDTQVIKDQKEIYYEWDSPIEDDGQYRLDVTAQDEAGNLSHLEEPFYFTIDKTPPRIYVKNDTLNREIKEDYDGEGMDVIVQSGFTTKEQLISVTINDKQLLEGQTNSLKIPLQATGEYDVEAVAEDEAGNITKKNLHFTIQENASNQNYLFIIGSLLVGILLIRLRLCKS